MESDPTCPILICGNFRGVTMPIRYLLHYLNVPFIQIHLNKQGEIMQKQKAHLIPKGQKFIQQQLPYLLHEGLCIEEAFAVMSYLSRRYQREDLLGKTLKDKVSKILSKTRVHEVMQIHAKKKSQKFIALLEIVRMVHQNPGNKEEILAKGFDYLLNYIDFIKPMLKLFMKTDTYVMGYFTVLDTIFYDACFYMTGIFGKSHKDRDVIKGFYKFKKMFEDEECYIKHKEILESYKIVIPEFPPEYNQALHTIWCGDPKFF